MPHADTLGAPEFPSLAISTRHIKDEAAVLRRTRCDGLSLTNPTHRPPSLSRTAPATSSSCDANARARARDSSSLKSLPPFDPGTVGRASGPSSSPRRGPFRLTMPRSDRAAPLLAVTPTGYAFAGERRLPLATPRRPQAAPHHPRRARTRRPFEAVDIDRGPPSSLTPPSVDATTTLPTSSNSIAHRPSRHRSAIPSRRVWNFCPVSTAVLFPSLPISGRPIVRGRVRRETGSDRLSRDGQGAAGGVPVECRISEESPPGQRPRDQASRTSAEGGRCHRCP